MSMASERAAGRTAVWQRPADERRTSPVRDPLARVYVWDKMVRLTHWLVALSTLVLAISGVYIGNPFVTVGNPGAGPPLMVTVKTIHFVAAIVFTLAVLCRIIWGFVGTGPARWPSFLPLGAQRWREMRQTFLFYVFLRRTFPPVLGHNPLAGATYLLLYLLFLVMVISGLGLHGAAAHLDSPLRWLESSTVLFGGLQSARWVHHAGMWLIAAFLIHHVYSALLAASVEKNGILESIFTGYKWVAWDHVYQRRYPRVAVSDVRAVLTCDGQRQAAVVRNISAVGAMLNVERPLGETKGLRPGAVIDLAAAHPRGKFRCLGQIVWSERRGTGALDLGVQLVDIDEEASAQLGSLLRRRSAL